MKTPDKQLRKVINQLVQNSFNKDGELAEEKVRKNITGFKDLPEIQAIQIASEYLKRLKAEMEKTTLEIHSALPLSNQEIKQIRDSLKADYKINQIKTVVNQELIGGIRVKVGDTIFDDSVIGKILQLGEVVRG